MLLANGFGQPDGEPNSPKLKRFALRSLILEKNFLVENVEGSVRGTSMTPHEYGEKLKVARDFNSSDNLELARTAMKNLIDPSTVQGQPGQHLLLPFHDSPLVRREALWS